MFARGGKRIAALVGGLGLVAVALAWSASAEPASRPASAAARPAPSAGATVLTKAAVRSLDTKIAAATKRAKTKPVRTAVNQLSWHGGDVVLTLPLPGETKARALGGARVAAKAAGCSYGYVCLFSSPGYTGARLSFTKCALRNLSKYGWTNRTSSWKNNQSKSTYSVLEYWTGKYRRVLMSTNAPSSVTYIGSPSDDRADYLRVC